ncbi:hypothetical protein EIP86_004092 [Pleurotus ostreatoroseus]|nr:hypothetical protein EIP86_004092 [Pleurotus ostreatoroseus]
MALKTSISEPLLSHSGSRYRRQACLGAIRAQYPIASGLLGQLDQCVLEQESVAKRLADLQDYVKECLFGGPSVTTLCKSLKAPDNLRLSMRRQFILASHSLSDALSDDGTADVLRQRNRQILELLNENESLRTQLDSVRQEAEQQASAKHRVKIEAERKSRLESETNASKATEILVQQNLRLTEARDSLQRKLAAAKAESEAWKEMAQNVQDMQEVAISAFERCNALDAENEDLRQAMNTFAEGSTSTTVQQLQTIITNLTAEVAQYKRREGESRSKENVLRSKENNSIIRAMRKQTRELKRRSLQAKHMDFGTQENAPANPPTFTVKVSVADDPALVSLDRVRPQ